MYPPGPESPPDCAPFVWSRCARAVLAAAVGLRVLLLLWTGPIPTSDTPHYVESGLSLAREGTFAVPDSVTGRPELISGRMPLYPATIAVLHLVTGGDLAWALAWTDVLLSVATVAVLLRLGQRVCGVRVAVLAGLLFALSPTSLEGTISMLPDTMLCFWGTLGTLIGLEALVQANAARAVWWGATIGLGAMTKPILKYFWAPAAGLMAWRALRHGRSLWLAVAVSAVPLVLLGGWATRNLAYTGRFSLDAYFGVNLLWSNMDLVDPATPEDRLRDPVLAQVRDIAVRHRSSGQAFDSVRRELGLDMHQADILFTRLGREALMAHPVRAVRRAAVNAADFFLSGTSFRFLLWQTRLLPAELESDPKELIRQRQWGLVAVRLLVRVPCVAFFYVLFPLGAVLLLRSEPSRTPAVLMLVTIGYHVLLGAPVASTDRYRLAVEPLLLVFTATAIVHLRDRYGSWRALRAEVRAEPPGCNS